MVRVVFTPHLERFLEAPAAEVSATSVADALGQVFAANPRLRSYVLDDHGHLRQHMNIFVNGQLTKDRARLSDEVDANAEIFVMQALSGGSGEETAHAAAADALDCDPQRPVRRTPLGKR